MLSIRQAFIHYLCLIVWGFLWLAWARAGRLAHGGAVRLLWHPEPYRAQRHLFRAHLRRNPCTLRRCKPGELGVVIARYQGIDGYDWVAIPLLPYLYSVENASDVPAHVDRDTVTRLRNRYREAHLESLGRTFRRATLCAAAGHNWWARPTSGASTPSAFRPPPNRTTP